MADPLVNFFRSTIVGAYSDADTNIEILTGDASKLPDPSVDGAFNLTLFKGGSGASADEFEVVRVTGITGDVLTVLRGQEGTTPLTITSDIHSIILSATKKTFDDINDSIAQIELADQSLNTTSTVQFADITSGIFRNPSTITSDITVASGENAMVVGDVDIQSTITVEGGSTFVII